MEWSQNIEGIAPYVHFVVLERAFWHVCERKTVLSQHCSVEFFVRRLERFIVTQENFLNSLKRDNRVEPHCDRIRRKRKGKFLNNSEIKKQSTLL